MALATRQEAAAFFKISVRQLDRLIKAGTIPVIKLGTLTVRIDLEEALRVLKAQRGD